MHNIIEDVAKDYLEQILLKRYDVCSCDKCKEDILAYALTRIPPKYVTTDSGAVYAVMEQARVEHQATIFKQLLKAVELISEKPHHEAAEDGDKAFALLLEQVFTERGLDFRHYRPALLRRRVAIRMRVHKVNTYADYLRVLTHMPKEYEELFNVMTINVSEFFRDPPMWEALRRSVYIPLIQDKIKQGKPHMRVWHAGCANGEEPYTDAILLTDILKGRKEAFRLEIIASDLDDNSLGIAQKGIYGKELLKNVSEKFMQQYFDDLGKGNFAVKNEIKQMISFKHQDMIQNEPFPNIDVVFCRNVFIYFDRSLQEHLLMMFYRALRVPGYLVLGKSETMMGPAKTIFEDLDAEERIYRKVP